MKDLEKVGFGGGINAKKQHRRQLMFDSKSWKLVLNLKGKEESISAFFRRLIKEYNEEQNKAKDKR